MTTPTTATCFQQAHQRYRRIRQIDDPNRRDNLQNEMVDFLNPENDGRIVVIPSLLLQSTAHRIDCSIDNVNNNNNNNDATDNHPSKLSYYTGPIYGLAAYPGFMIAPHALSVTSQEWLAHSAVSTYCEFPHGTNLDTTTSTSSRQEGTPITVTTIDSIHSNSKNSTDTTMWERWKEEKDTSSSSSQPEQQQRQRTLQKLSWSTLGYHYDWTHRSYHPNRQQSPIPMELSRLADVFAETYRMCFDSSSNRWDAATATATAGDVTTTMSSSSSSSKTAIEPPLPSSMYEATACIVNYYHNKSVMGGHRDDLEVAIHQPVISMSFGRSAVFLFGGPTLNDAPVVPIIVRAGDVIVFGGPCRLNYHSMPCLLPPPMSSNDTISSPSRLTATTSPREGNGATTKLPQSEHSYQIQVEDILDPTHPEQQFVNKLLQNEETCVQEQLAIRDFLSQHRININLRQVY
jgi:alkylated DNA repair dioxygenase AlkB